MIRLFVGIELPPELRLRLSLLCSGVPGARWVDPGNLHLTLRFIGEVDEGTAADIDEALAEIRAPRFTLTLAGTGHFGGGTMPRALWVGVEKNPALSHLHDKIEAALTRLGLAPEGRRYTPHVTLARCEALAAPGVVDEFRSRNAAFGLPRVEVTAFGLFSSALVDGVPVYRRERSFPLLATGDKGAMPRGA